MGWGSATNIYEQVIHAIMDEGVDAPTRHRIHMRLIPAFEDQDWDTQGECEGIDGSFDSALEALHPEWFGDD